MGKNTPCLTFIGLTLLGFGPAFASDAVVSAAPAVLWKEPVDIKTRDLFYGPGGEKHVPKGPFEFEKEDMDGTNPKLVVRDPDGTKWKVKLGEEARPETVASRLVWSAGYFTDEDYFMPVIRITKLPRKLQRGQNQVSPDGDIQNVRLKRYLKDEEKAGEWHWKNDPFTGTRELNGLRVMMALINNWDRRT